MVNRPGSCPGDISSNLIFYNMSKSYNNLNKFTNIPTSIVQFILLTINNIKSLLPLNFQRLNKNYFFALIDSHIIHYPTPIILTYAWSFGSLAGIC